MSLIIFAFFAFLILPPLDYRVGISPVPAYVSFVGDIVILVPLILPVLVWRLLDEERILRRDLSGYNEYASRVRHRLIPYFW